MQHDRWEHMNYSYINKMVDIGLILKLSLENYRKCESCKEYKTTKKTYKIVNRK